MLRVNDPKEPKKYLNLEVSQTRSHVDRALECVQVAGAETQLHLDLEVCLNRSIITFIHNMAQTDGNFQITGVWFTQGNHDVIIFAVF